MNTAKHAPNGTHVVNRGSLFVREAADTASIADKWLDGAREDLKRVAPMIEVDRRGIAYVEGTTTKVNEIVLNQRLLNQTPEELQPDLPHLTVLQIKAALAYYEQNQVTCDTQMATADEFMRRLAEEAGESPFARRLKAKTAAA